MSSFQNNNAFPSSLSELSALSAGPAASAPPSSTSFLAGFTWQTWAILVLLLAFLGINLFVYFAKGTDAVVQLFTPILKLFGFTALTTTKQTIETSATGTKAGVDIVANTATDTIDQITGQGTTQGTSQGQGTTQGTTQGQRMLNPPQPSSASTSLPVQHRIQQTGANIDTWQQNSLAKALENAKTSVDSVLPDDSRSSIQTTGKAGWCYIGDEGKIRTCAEVGVNDVCMSGDVFPNQAICVNPNLRA